MHNLGLTDLESLEEERLVIPGLDVDSAMANSIAKGKKKIRNKRIAQAASAFSALLLIAGVSGAVALNLRSDDGTATKQTATTLAKKQSSTTDAPTTTAATTVPLTTTPVLVPKLITLRTFGNQSACTVNAQSNGDGVTVGSAAQVEKFTAKVGQTFTIEGGNPSQRIKMAVKQHVNATNGAYVELVSGYTTNGSYGSVTTQSLTYCESGLKMNIESLPGKAADGSSTYTLSTERW